jgi:hypothetical protein
MVRNLERVRRTRHVCSKYLAAAWAPWTLKRLRLVQMKWQWLELHQKLEQWQWVKLSQRLMLRLMQRKPSLRTKEWTCTLRKMNHFHFNIESFQLTALLPCLRVS